MIAYVPCPMCSPLAWQWDVVLDTNKQAGSGGVLAEWPRPEYHCQSVKSHGMVNEEPRPALTSIERKRVGKETKLAKAHGRRGGRRLWAL